MEKKEAMKILKDFHDKSALFSVRTALDTIIPELKESEDEQHRKWILDYLYDGLRKSDEQFNGHFKAAIAWLEKQHEQKHKFNIGDIISNGQAVYRVDDITKNCIGQDCYFLVNVEYEKNGTLYLSLTDSEGKHSNVGVITLLCEQADKSFEKQGEQNPANKVEPKFKVGDTMRTLQEAADGYTDGMPVVISVDKEYYHCTNELIAIKDQDDYEYPPMNRIQTPTDKVEPKFKVGDKIKLVREPKYPAREIIAIQNDAYYFDKLVYLQFIHQDEWELVEQKPADNVEAKFKVGDWITDGYLHCKISDVLDDRYIVDTKFAKRSAIPFKCENNYHLWAIQDAKDGDVLAVESIGRYKFPFIAIYKNYGLNFFNSYCSIGFDGKFYEADTEHVLDDIHPATKEQRDLLFQKMKEAGYTFDFEKKELKKIEQEPTECKEKKHSKCYVYNLPHNDEMCEQCEFNPKNKKPAEWGEEDEKKRKEKVL